MDQVVARFAEPLNSIIRYLLQNLSYLVPRIWLEKQFLIVVSEIYLFITGATARQQITFEQLNRISNANHCN